MSRSQEFSRNQVRDAIKAAGGNLAEVAKMLNCERRTVYNYIDRFKALKALVEKERQNKRNYRIWLAESNLDAALESGEKWATEYTLSTLAKKQGYTRSLDLKHSGSQENPVNVVTATSWKKQMRAQAAKAGKTLTE